MGARKFSRFASPFSRLIGRGLAGRLMDFCGFARLNLNLRFAAALFFARPSVKFTAEFRRIFKAE